MTESAESLNLTNKSFPLERYEPTALLGRGGLGEVYLAKDRLLGRAIAVKCLMAVDDEQVVIFQREAKIASKLHHPNIIGTLDFGTTEGGRPFIAFEYFDGISLERLIQKRGGVLDEALARRIFIVVAEALGYIHDHNVFHRDLKPSNILLKVDKTGAIDLKIIDFGVSAIKEEFQNRDLAQGKTIVGTPVYMSPDPVRGEPFDARSEVYSVGCILFECLTGQPPFDSSSTAEVLELHMHDEPPLLEEVAPDGQFSAEIQEIICKCLSKAKSARFQNMTELVQALEKRVAPKRSTIDTAPPVESANKRVGPGRFIALGTGVLVIVIAATALASSILSNPQKDDVSNILKKQNNLNEVSNADSERTKEPFDQHATNTTARGLYLSGKYNLAALKSVVDAGGTKDIVSLTSFSVKPKDVENLVAVRPRLVQFIECLIAPPVFLKLETIKTATEFTFHKCRNVSPADISSLKNSQKLISLRLIGCGLTNEHMKALGEIKQLQQLVIDGNPEVTMEGLLHLKRKGPLIAVWLNEGPLTKLTSEEIAELKQKHHIFLWNKLVRYEGDGGDGMVHPDALELID
ncbi:MAG: serine/threonine-protein kinase [Candidatus Melainabacteria bacterium]|nr:serine/threonine-protein kinase [Candidatus Melainabacteria bacterium]